MSADVNGQSSTTVLGSVSPRRLPRAAFTALFFGALFATGCDREPGEGSAGAAADTAAEGLSQEQLQQQAQPMSREQAEQLGIVDTTEAEQPSPVRPGDSEPVVPLDTAAPPSP